MISITDNGSQTAANNGLEVFEHHSDEVCKVCVNFDATMLASGDKTGSYCIWDISNGQCLKASSLKGKHFFNFFHFGFLLHLFSSDFSLF